MRLDATDLEQFRSVIREEIQATTVAAPSGWLSVKGVADYLDTTEDAIRALVKRKQIPHDRAPTGRLLFSRSELDQWVRGE